MFDFFIWILAGLVLLMFGGIIVGFICAAVYDAWYKRKYQTWIALQEDHNQRRRPAAK